MKFGRVNVTDMSTSGNITVKSSIRLVRMSLLIPNFNVPEMARAEFKFLHLCHIESQNRRLLIYDIACEWL